MGLFNRPTAEARFWEWFQRNSERIFHFEADPEAVFAELSAELIRVHKGLTFELGPVEGGRREFIVSADGVRRVIPAVERLVAAAPQMSQWTVVAFRQPKSLEAVIRIGEIELGAGDIWFAARPEGQRIGLRLYIRGLGEENRQALGQAAFILLDCALGEYDVATRVGTIEFLPLPEDTAALGLRPFHEIRGLFP